MKIRIKRAWATYRVGDVIEPPASLRQLLCDRGFAEPLKEKIEVAAAPEVETATRTAKRRIR